MEERVHFPNPYLRLLPHNSIFLARMPTAHRASPPEDIPCKTWPASICDCALTPEQEEAMTCNPFFVAQTEQSHKDNLDNTFQTLKLLIRLAEP